MRNGKDYYLIARHIDIVIVTIRYNINSCIIRRIQKDHSSLLYVATARAFSSFASETSLATISISIHTLEAIARNVFLKFLTKSKLQC